MGRVSQSAALRVLQSPIPGCSVGKGGQGRSSLHHPMGGGDSGPDVQIWTLARSWLLGGGSPGGRAKVLGSQEVRMFWVNFRP